MHLPPRLPFSPSSSRLFYGWIILVLGTVGVLMSVPGQTAGVSAFTDFLIRDLGVSRTNLSLAYLIGTLTSAFLLTHAGHIYDLHGARLVGTVVAIALGLSVLLLSFLPQTVALLSSLGLPAAPSAFVLLTIGFFLVRFFGQGVLSLVARNMVLKWFEVRRGLANALVGIANTIGFSAAPLFFTAMIDRLGWQGAWRFSGLVIAIPFALLFLLLARDNPRECGLLPDNGLEPRLGGSRPEARPNAEFTLPQARRTLPFWVFLGVVTLASMYITGLTFHVVSIFAEAGLSRVQAVSIFLPSSVIALVLNLVGGWASDLIRLKYLAMAQLLGILLSTVAVFFLSTPLTVLLLIIGLGLNSGMFGIIVNVPWPRFFGTTHLGRISGFAAGWAVAGSAIGPYLFSLALDIFGTYGAASIIALVVTLILLVLAPFANRPPAPVSPVG